jgi:membrane-associated phospholipid phosphatase
MLRAARVVDPSTFARAYTQVRRSARCACRRGQTLISKPLRRQLTLYASSATATLICVFFVDRPAANFVQNQFEATPVFAAAVVVLRFLRAMLAALITGFLGSAAWVLSRRRLGRWGVLVLQFSAAAMAALAVALTLKFVIGRSQVYPGYLTRRIYEIRPLHGGEEYAAFPSAALAVAGATLSVLWVQLSRWRVVFAAVLALVACSVLITNSHWVSDILAGACLGWFIGTRLVRTGTRSEPTTLPT